jgi:hypothetical protein
MALRAYLLLTAACLVTALNCLAATTQPSPITLRVKDATPKDVLADLSRQTESPIPVVPQDLFDKNPLPRITLDLDNQPFWIAMETLGRTTGLEPLASPDDPYPRLQVGLGTGAFWDEPHVISGPLLLFVTDIARTTTVELGKKEHTFDRELTLNLTAFIEPGLRVLAASQDVTLKQAVDETGRSLLPTDTPTPGSVLSEETLGGSQFTWNLAVGLQCPSPVGKRIAKLRGVAQIRLQTKSDVIEIEDVLKIRNINRTVAGAPFTFKSLKKADIEYILQITVRRDKKSEADWQMLHQSIYNGMMALYDEKGRLVAGRATENGGDYGGTKIDATLRFVREQGVSDPNAGEPYKLVWHAPLASKNLPVEFELTDLPIPE